jgi:hypothetical protein
MSWIRSRLTYANVVSTLALFLAVSAGGAYAANTIGSSDIIDESLLSQDIKNGEVKNADLAENSITSTRLANGSIQNSDLGPDAVTTSKIKAGNVDSTDLADNAVTTAKIANGQVGSADVANNTLTGADVNESSLNLGSFFAAASGVGGCNADGGAEAVCATTTLTLPRAGRVLVNATGMWRTFAFDAGSPTDDVDAVWGQCRLVAAGVTVGAPQQMGERRTIGGAAQSHAFPAEGTMALTGVSAVLPAGAATIEADCTEQDGDIDWNTVNLTAALVDDDGAAETKTR